MPVAPLSSHGRTNDGERRGRILDAAERAFAEHGFHAATMQHVAEAAGMSAGNLYRTFPSKEAIVEGLCERDQQERVENFGRLAEVEDIFAAVAAGIREHIGFRSRQKVTLIVEIWAEAARNPAVAAITRAIDADVLGKLERLVALAKERGEAAPTVDPGAVALFFFTYVGGLMKRLALEPDLDAEVEAARASELFKALCRGAFGQIGGEASR